MIRGYLAQDKAVGREIGNNPIKKESIIDRFKQQPKCPKCVKAMCFNKHDENKASALMIIMNSHRYLSC